MTSKRKTGIVFYLFSRVFLAIAACALFIPAAYLPIYKSRITDIIEVQAGTFASTLLAVQSEALYLEDYFSVIEYTQNVLRNTSGIDQVSVIKSDETGFVIEANQWSMITDGDHGRHFGPEFMEYVAAVPSYFVLHKPIVISNYDWGHLEVRLAGEKFDELIADYYFNYSLLALGIILGVLTLMFVSSRPIVRQLENLRDSANRLAHGELTARVDEQAIGELAHLSSSFNEMAQALEEKTEHVEQLANVVEETNDGFIIFDRDQRIVFTNRTFISLIREVTNRSPIDLATTLSFFDIDPAVKAQISSYDFENLSFDTVLSSSNPAQHIELRLQRISGHGERQQLVLSTSDITHRKSLESRLNDLANYDKLSGLPNRRLFTAALEDAIAEQDKFVVLFMDLDNFKVVNDSLGHDAGDVVINTIGQRLKTCLRDADTLARLGGDEFTAILANAPSPEQTEDLCQRIISEISAPLQYEERDLRLGISIGAVRVPEDAATVTDILKFADAAMYDAKQAGKMNYSFFSSNMLKRIVDVLDTEEALRKALRDDELAIYYQPVLNAQKGVLFTEALVRWPRLNIPPQEFITIAERSALITELDRWVFSHTLEQLRVWRSKGYQPTISLNVSPRTLQNEHAADDIIAMIADAEVAPTQVQIEITESLLLDAESHAMANLEKLRQNKVKIALDDFGTGYSSLSYLNNLRIDTLKLDRNFVAECHTRKGAGIIAGSIIEMSNQLGLCTVAEGVENQAQLDWLIKAGCNGMQGFHLGKPIPSHKFEQRWLKRDHSLNSDSLSSSI